MDLKRLINYLWKLLICLAVVLASVYFEAKVVSFIGFGVSRVWDRIFSNPLFIIIGSFLTLLVLSNISQNLHINWFFRCIIIEMFLWEISIVSLVLISFFPATTGFKVSLSSTLLVALGTLLPSLVLSVLIASFFRPIQGTISRHTKRNILSVTWRLVAGCFAYPLVHSVSSLFVQSIFLHANGMGFVEQTSQSWILLLSLQVIHGLIISLSSLPVIKWWRGGEGKLWWILGFSFFLLPSITTAFCTGEVKLNFANLLMNILIGFGFARVLVSLFSQSTIVRNDLNICQHPREICGFAELFRQKI